MEFWRQGGTQGRQGRSIVTGPGVNILVVKRGEGGGVLEAGRDTGEAGDVNCYRPLC